MSRNYDGWILLRGRWHHLVSEETEEAARREIKSYAIAYGVCEFFYTFVGPAGSDPRRQHRTPAQRGRSRPLVFSPALRPFLACNYSAAGFARSVPLPWDGLRS